jgi:hypothetical protein
VSLYCPLAMPSYAMPLYTCARLHTSHDHFVAALLSDCAAKVKKCVVAGLDTADAKLLGNCWKGGDINAVVINLSQVRTPTPIRTLLRGCCPPLL